MTHTIFTIGLRELKNSIGNHYLLGMTFLLAMLASALVMLGDTPFGSASASPLSMQITSLSSLSIFFIPLMALFMSYDAIVGEYEQGSLLLILSYPVKRYQFILGKFFSNWLSLSIAIIFGYGSIFSLLFLNEENINIELINAYLTLIGTSILLGGVFIAIAYLISTLVNKRSMAIIYCIAVWLFFIIFFDMLLLIILVNESVYLISADTLNNLLLLNPVDIFRIVSIGEQGNNLLPLQAIANISTISSFASIVALLTWISLPLGLSIYLFKKKVL
jgi:Cu-processing system permease protein